MLYPQAKIVAGYDDIMPTFKGLVTEDGLLKLVEYVKSLGPKDGTESSATPAPTQTSSTPQAPAKPAADNARRMREAMNNGTWKADRVSAADQWVRPTWSRIYKGHSV